jgi:LmbE family N-acetylglucosaminyl deacetylase
VIEKVSAEPGSPLSIGAHPDDVEIGCGGILAQHRDRRDRIVIVTLTGDEQGGVKDTRILESEEAARLLGAELVFGGLRDTQVPEGRETISVIEDVIRSVEPDTVYTHTCRDRHQDHRNAYCATMVAARSVPNVFCYQSPSTTVDFQPTRFVDIAQRIDEKLAAIAKYQTQVNSQRYLPPSLVRSTAEYWGRFASYRLVEPLEVVRSVE